jgi:hypothetical protein
LEKQKRTRKPKDPKAPKAPRVDTFLPFEVKKGPGWVIIQLPIRTVSEANNFDHWRVKNARKKKNNDLVKLALNPVAPLIKLPCIVTLKRFGKGHLDEFENLPMSFKNIVDCIAEILTGKGRGRGDSDPRIIWRAEQEKSSDYGVRITFVF